MIQSRQFSISDIIKGGKTNIAIWVFCRIFHHRRLDWVPRGQCHKSAVKFYKNILKIFFESYHITPWQGSISRPIVPVSLMAGGDDTTRPRRRGIIIKFLRNFLVFFPYKMSMWKFSWLAV
jgi:hypothetical protein